MKADMLMVLLALSYGAGAITWGTIEYGEGVKYVNCSICETCPDCTPDRLITMEQAIETTTTETDKETLRWICNKESGCTHGVYRVTTGQLGEIGGGQIRKATAEQFDCGNTADVRENVRCMDKVYQSCLKRWENKTAALCCYNGALINESGTCRYAEK